MKRDRILDGVTILLCAAFFVWVWFLASMIVEAVGGAW